MGTVKIGLPYNVLEAAKIRIKTAFSNKRMILMSFSSGKDSICLSNLVYTMILNGEIDKSLLRVIFFDEEGLYPSMVKSAELWHDKFEKIGVPFIWFCLPVKQNCVINGLSASESWVTWDPLEKDKWMRKPPKYAVFGSSLLKYAGEMNYQTFAAKLAAKFNAIQMLGLRCAESATRRQAIARHRPSKNMHVSPIYDWSNTDVWLYIKNNNLYFPEAYLKMYELGATRQYLRLCCFFGECSINGLRLVAELDNEFWEKINRRMPNAYLALLYWDSEMFGRSTAKRRELEADEEEVKDYRKMTLEIVYGNHKKYNIGHDTIKVLPQYAKLILNDIHLFDESLWKKTYQHLIYGDTKARFYRILRQELAVKRWEDCNKGGEVNES